MLFGAVAGSYFRQLTSSPDWEISIVIQALLTLHTQCPRLQRCVAEMDAGFVREDPSSVDTANDIADAVKQIVHAYGRLRKHVIEFDRELYGDRVKSLGELALRGQRFVIAMCMRSLRAELENATDRDRHERALQLALDGKFMSFDDMASFVAGELLRITSRWLPLRDALLAPAPVSTPSSPSDRECKALYLVAIRGAQQEMAAVGDGKFGEVLRAGLRCRRWPTFRRVCLRMRVALQAHPVPELELSALIAQATSATRWRAESARAQG